MNCILPRTAREMETGTLCLLSCSWMTAKLSYFVFWCDHSKDSNGYYYVTASWVPYHIHTTRRDHSSCAELRFSTPHKMIKSYSIIIMVTAKKKEKNNGTLAVYRTSRGDWHVLQHCFQPTPSPIDILRSITFYSVGANRGQLLYIAGGRRS